MSKETKILFTLLIIILGAGAVYYVNSNKQVNNMDSNSDLNSNTNLNQNTNSNPNPVNTNSNNNNTSTSTSNVSSVRTLSASIKYQVPEEHFETLNVSVTVANGVVTSVKFSESPSNRESAEYWDSFVSNFKQGEVEGKSLKDVKLSRVGGASLTTMAFNRAIDQLSNQ